MIISESLVLFPELCLPNLTIGKKNCGYSGKLLGQLNPPLPRHTDEDHWVCIFTKRCIAVAPRRSWDFPLRAKSNAANKFRSWLLGWDSAGPFFFFFKKEKVLTTVCLTDSSCVSSGAAGRLTREKCDINTATALKGDSFWLSLLIHHIDLRYLYITVH